MDLSIEYLHVFLQLVFVLSGISKFVPDRRVIREHFPLLPSAFWIVAGSWELMMVALLWFQQDFVATVMIYVFMGGVFGASLLLKGDGGSTAAQKTYGLILIPAIFTLYVTVMLAQLREYSLLISIPATLTGVLVSLIVGKESRKRRKQK